MKPHSDHLKNRINKDISSLLDKGKAPLFGMPLIINETDFQEDKSFI